MDLNHLGSATKSQDFPTITQVTASGINNPVSSIQRTRNVQSTVVVMRGCPHWHSHWCTDDMMTRCRTLLYCTTWLCSSSSFVLTCTALHWTTIHAKRQLKSSTTQNIKDGQCLYLSSPSPTTYSICHFKAPLRKNTKTTKIISHPGRWHGKKLPRKSMNIECNQRIYPGGSQKRRW